MLLRKTNIIRNARALSILNANEFVYMIDNMVYKNSVPILQSIRPSNLKSKGNLVTLYENNTRETIVYSTSQDKVTTTFNNVVIQILDEGILSRNKAGIFLRNLSDGEIKWESDIITKKLVDCQENILVFHEENNSNISALSKSDGTILWTITLDFVYKKHYRTLIVFGIYNDLLWIRFSAKLIGISTKDGKVVYSCDEEVLGLRGNLNYGYFDKSSGNITTGILNSFSRLDLSTNEVYQFFLDCEDTFRSFRKLSALKDHIILLDDSKSKICLTDLDFNIIAIEPLSNPRDNLPSSVQPLRTSALTETSFIIKDNHNNLHFYEIQ